MERIIIFTVEEFKTQIQNKSFIEWEEVYKNNFYGTLKDEIATFEYEETYYF